MKKGELFVCAGLGEIKSKSIIKIMTDCECELPHQFCSGTPMTMIEENEAVSAHAFCINHG